MNGSSQGNGAPEAPQGETSGPNYVTEDRFNEMLNRAITARLSGYDKKLVSLVSEAVNGMLPKLDEIVTAKITPSPSSTTSTSERLEEHPLVKGLQKQLAEVQEQNKRSQAERDAERQRARDVGLRQRLTEELSKHGVDSRYVKQATGYLVDSEKRVRWSDDDAESIIFRDADGSDLDLLTGLRSWVKTDEAKIYQPPRGVQGSGDRGAGQAPKTMGQERSRENLAQALLANLTGAGRLAE